MSEFEQAVDAVPAYEPDFVLLSEAFEEPKQTISELVSGFVRAGADLFRGEVFQIDSSINAGETFKGSEERFVNVAVSFRLRK